jgi:hypothetical protein
MRHKKSFLVYKKVITDSRNKAVKGNLMTIHPQRGQGMSSIVFSSSLTIADAIAAAVKSKSIWKVTEFEQVGMSAACRI